MNPNLSDTRNHILMYPFLGNWTNRQLSFNSLISTLIYFVIAYFLINKIKNFRFYNTILIAVITLNVANLMNFEFVYIMKFTYINMYLLRIVIQIIQQLGCDMSLIPVVGRFSSTCPEGIENLGVTSIVSISGIGLTLSDILGSLVLNVFSVTTGEYDNFGKPILVGCIYTVIILLLTPFVELLDTIQ